MRETIKKKDITFKTTRASNRRFHKSEWIISKQCSTIESELWKRKFYMFVKLTGVTNMFFNYTFFVTIILPMLLLKCAPFLQSNNIKILWLLQKYHENHVTAIWRYLTSLVIDKMQSVVVDRFRVTIIDSSMIICYMVKVIHKSKSILKLYYNWARHLSNFMNLA